MLGWISTFCFTVCTIPQIVKSHKQGHANDISWLFLLLWLIGEICAFIYVFHTKNVPLLTNYILNTLLLVLLIIIKYKGRNEAS